MHMPKTWRRHASRWRHAMMLGVVALASTSCSSSEFLGLEDPDIINPANVQSAAGANAVRLGALARLNTATSGGESLLLLGGLFTDEWINGDSFIGRQEIDQRSITVQNSFLTDASRGLHRARLAAQQGIALLTEFAPAAPTWQVAEMYFVQAYIENIAAEHFCSGLVFSSVVDGVEQYGTPMTTADAFTRALAHADSGLAIVTGTTTDAVRVTNALKVVRGRILLNLNRYADAAAAVNGVPTTFKYDMFHAATATSNNMWSFNNLAWRYSVGNGEGTNGVNFATAADPRLPVCVGNDTVCRANGVTRSSRDDLRTPLHVQLVWPARESSVSITSGVEARLIEAEAQLAQNPGTALATLNTLRGTVAGLGQLADAGTPDARVSQLFRERAIWLFGRGYRTGDMRRLIRQYNRAATSVFPTGDWHKDGGVYGSDVTMPVPQAELNNPNVSGNTCIDRNP